MIRTILVPNVSLWGCLWQSTSICRPGLGGQFPAAAAAGTSPSGAPLGHAGGRPGAGPQRRGPALPSGPVGAAGGCAGTGGAVKSRADRDGCRSRQPLPRKLRRPAGAIARGTTGRRGSGAAPVAWRRSPCGVGRQQPAPSSGGCSLRSSPAFVSPAMPSP